MLSLKSIYSEPSSSEESSVADLTSKDVATKYEASCLEEIEKYAIKAQDVKPTDTKCRALIIAPQYWTHMRGVSPLGKTLEDVVKIYEMLGGPALVDVLPVALIKPPESYGYEAANIRILVDESNNAAPPTRDNILAGLKWLLEDVRDNDRRFLYFSGHGTSVQTTKDKGKETVDLPNLATDQQYTRIDSITIPDDQVKYYREGILASYSGPPKRGPHRVEDYLVYDEELNKNLSRLRKGKLTCVLDGFAGSAAIAEGYSGNGFRGVWSSSEEVADPGIPIPDALLKDISDSKKFVFTPKFTSAPLVELREGLSAQDIRRDKISADVAFTEAVKELKNSSPTVEKVYEEINEAIKKRAGDAAPGFSFLQYAQVWTSLGLDDEQRAIKKLQERFNEYVWY
ncbi:hypothetical protein BDV93DRAFT_548683 [Ceratobasidium sp. AG-I]|nr:hypothetical protein BDV93DRAFT_548683 [Ceratobasidium sp. AG-I]